MDPPVLTSPAAPTLVPPVPSAAVHPRIMGLLDGASSGMPTSLAAAWAAGLRGGLRVASRGPWGLEAWAGPVPCWPCLGCDGVFLAPWRIAVLGTEAAHRRSCRASGRGGAPDGLRRFLVLMRVRDPGISRRDLDRACAVHGGGGAMPPWASSGDIPGTRADERWLEVWASPAAMDAVRAGLGRIRDVRELPPPSGGPAWL